mmetsp:Transcript_16438/g.32149  ORF Transcript_16438/g.32149 Transcript_16438/m.32149 type:complete len:231 (+) Transcript_16438:228-920(+)
MTLRIFRTSAGFFDSSKALSFSSNFEIAAKEFSFCLAVCSSIVFLLPSIMSLHSSRERLMTGDGGKGYLFSKLSFECQVSGSKSRILARSWRNLLKVFLDDGEGGLSRARRWCWKVGSNFSSWNPSFVEKSFNDGVLPCLTFATNLHAPYARLQKSIVSCNASVAKPLPRQLFSAIITDSSTSRVSGKLGHKKKLMSPAISSNASTFLSPAAVLSSITNAPDEGLDIHLA